MKALLLSAGLGTRLGSITKQTPKCLVKVGKNTMLDHWLFKLEALGVEEFFINTHHHAEKVEAFISRHKLKPKIELIYEKKLIGTAGTVLANLEKIQSENCFIIHVDNYCEDPLKDFLIAHKQRPTETLLTMLTFNTDHPENCGVVKLDENNKVIGFFEKQVAVKSSLANGAVFLASTDFFKELKKFSFPIFDLSEDVIPNLLGKIFSFQTKMAFEDIGTPKTLRKANKIARTNISSAE